MSVDYVQIHTIDLASLERRNRDDASLGRVMRQVIADLSDDNGDSEYEFVRNALASAATGRETRRRQTEAARAAKKSSSEGEKVLSEESSSAMPSFADKVVQYEATSNADTPESSVRKAEEGDKSPVLCNSGASAMVSRKAAREEFEAFRKAYPGTRRGADVEWKAFLKNASPEEVPLLMPALLREKEHKEECARVGAFCPQWANLSTWINQRRWTQELSTPRAPQVRKTSEDLENDRKAKMVQILKDREAGIPTGDDYDQMLDAECGGDDDA